MAANYHLVNHSQTEQLFLGRVEHTAAGQPAGFSQCLPEQLAAYLAEHIEDELEFVEGYTFDERRYILDYATITTPAQ